MDIESVQKKLSFCIFENINNCIYLNRTFNCIKIFIQYYLCSLSFLNANSSYAGLMYTLVRFGSPKLSLLGMHNVHYAYCPAQNHRSFSPNLITRHWSDLLQCTVGKDTIKFSIPIIERQGVGKICCRKEFFRRLFSDRNLQNFRFISCNSVNR